MRRPTHRQIFVGGVALVAGTAALLVVRDCRGAHGLVLHDVAYDSDLRGDDRLHFDYELRALGPGDQSLISVSCRADGHKYAAVAKVSYDRIAPASAPGARLVHMMYEVHPFPDECQVELRISNDANPYDEVSAACLDPAHDWAVSPGRCW